MASGIIKRKYFQQLESSNCRDTSGESQLELFLKQIPRLAVTKKLIEGIKVR